MNQVTIDDAVGARYSGMPGRFSLLGPEGKVAYESGRGPVGFKSAEIEQSLVMLLRQLGKGDSKPDPSPAEVSSKTKPVGFDAKPTRLRLLMGV